MKFSTFTAAVITAFTNRHCIRFTEMAYVVCAVFESGRPQFISKDALYTFTVRRECLNGAKLQAEWKIGKYAKQAQPATNLEVIKRRVERAGFERVEIDGNRVVGMLIAMSVSDRAVALQIAKEEGWAMHGDYVIAA